MAFSSTLLDTDFSNREWVLVGALLGSQGEDIPGKRFEFFVMQVQYHPIFSRRVSGRGLIDLKL